MQKYISTEREHRHLQGGTVSDLTLLAGLCSCFAVPCFFKHGTAKKQRAAAAGIVVLCKNAQLRIQAKIRITPKWDKTILAYDHQYVIKYGLRNKRELYRLYYMIFKTAAMQN